MELVLMSQSAPYFADFCYRGKGLSREYCLREFGEYLNGRVFHDCDGVDGYTYGMFIEPDDEVVLNLDVAQFLWCDNIDVFVPMTKAVTLYVSNRSRINLTCEGYNSVRIYLFDESEVNLCDIDEDSNVVVYRYSDESKVEKDRFCLSKKVKTFRKQLRL